MNTKHLTTFVTFAQEKSMLKTSMKLFYAESTLADHIASLERELGVKLIESGPRGSRLTAAGEVFWPKAESLLEQWKDIQREMLRMSGVHRLNIVAAESLALNLLPSIYDEFLRKYQDIPVFIANGHPGNFCNQLKNHEVDVAFGYYWGKVPGSTFDFIKLCTDQLVFFASPNHRLAGRTNISIQDFAAERMLFTKRDSVYYEEAAKIFKQAGIKMQTDFFIDSAELIKRHVMRNQAIGFLARSSIHRELEAGTLVELDIGQSNTGIDIVAVTLLKNKQEPVIQKLIQIAAKLASRQCRDYAKENKQKKDLL